MDARQSIKRLLKGNKAPSYHKRLTHVRNRSSLAAGGGGGSAAAFSALTAGLGPGEMNGSDALLGDDFSREMLMRIVNKEVIEKPGEQEVLFLCAVNKSKALKYNIGGLVGGGGGGGGGERSRFLCVALEIGSRPPFAPAPLDNDEGEEGRDSDVSGGTDDLSLSRTTAAAGLAAAAAANANAECFVVVYYFTVSLTMDVQVTIKSDVYLNDLISVEYGSGSDFTLTFEQTAAGATAANPPFQLSAPSQGLRDEIVWNLLTVCDVFCRVQPETRAVDLHGLSLTATTQNFMARNETLARFMALAMEYEKTKGGSGGQGGAGGAGGGGGGSGATALLMDPFLSSHSNDEEVEAMLDKFQWPAQTVDDIDAKLSAQLKQLERETIEVLLSWETTAKEQTTPSLPPPPPPTQSTTATTNKQTSSKGKTTTATTAPPPPPPPPAQPEPSKGYLSTLQLVDMLDDLAGELELMETWLSSKGDALTLMQTDMQEIEAENNRLERQWKNYSRLNTVLKPLVLELSMDPDSERLLRNPSRQLDIPGVMVVGGSGGGGGNERGSGGARDLSDSQTSTMVVERVDVLVGAAKRLQHALALLEGRDLPEFAAGASGGGGGGGGGSSMEEALSQLALNQNKTSTTSTATPLSPPPIKVPLPSALAPLPPTTTKTAPNTQTQTQTATAPTTIKPLKAIPRRLMSMESLRKQSTLFADVRGEFLEKATKYLSLLFPKVVRPESLPGGGGAGSGGGGGGGGGGGRNSVGSGNVLLLTPQGLGNYQRMFHTRLLDYEGLVEVVVQMLQDVTTGALLLDDLLHAYSDAGNATLYRPLLKMYFAQLQGRMVGASGGGGGTNTGGSSSALGMSSSNVDGALSPPLVSLNTITSAAMASLPRAHINDFGANAAVALPPPSSSSSLRTPSSSSSGSISVGIGSARGASNNNINKPNSPNSDVASYYQQQASLLQSAMGGMAPSLAIGQALTQLVPLVKREQSFVMQLFQLKSDEEEDHRKLQSVLEVEFDKMREKLTEQAEAATEVDPLEGLAILAVMKQTLDPSSGGGGGGGSGGGGFFQGPGEGMGMGMGGNNNKPASTVETDDRFMSELLLSLQQSLASKFNRFISEQDTWIQHQSPDIKRAGVLAPLAKFPIFVDRLALAVRGRPIEIANAALQKLSSSLLGWLEKLATKGDPKYADVVRLENYHFFVQTLSPRQQRLVGSSALTPYIDQAQACHEAAVQRYIAWSLEYEFPQLTAFFGKLEELIVKVGLADVSIHVPKAALLKLLQEPCSRKQVSEGLTTAFRRLRKHISDDSGLFLPLWDRITALLYQRFLRYEEVALKIYEVKLEPSAALVRQLAVECRKS